MPNRARHRLSVLALAALLPTAALVTAAPLSVAGGERVHAAKGKKKSPHKNPFGKRFNHEYAVTAISLKIAFEADYNARNVIFGTKDEQWVGSWTVEITDAGAGTATFRNYHRKGEGPATPVGSLNIPAGSQTYSQLTKYFKRGEALEDQFWSTAVGPDVNLLCKDPLVATSALTGQFFLATPKAFAALFPGEPTVVGEFDTFMPNIECRDKGDGFTVKYPRSSKVTTKIYSPKLFAGKTIELPLDLEYDYKAPEGGRAQVRWTGSLTLKQTKANPVK
jgi:hypothetical protein